MTASSREIARLEKAQQVFDKMLNFDMDSLQRSNILRKAGDNCLEILKCRSDRQTAERALFCYETALQSYTADRHPIYRAMTLRGLGFAYAACADGIEMDWGKRAQWLRSAVACWEEALSHYSLSSSPQDYLSIQEGLGRSYRKLAEMENREDNALKAARACQEALGLLSKEDSPLQFAALMADLAGSHLTLAQAEDRSNNCKKAISAYREALLVYTADCHPQQYAAMQNNLAVAYLSLAEEGAGRDEESAEEKAESRAEYCRLAIAACKEALIYRTAKEYPLAYAATENNLGNAYFALTDDDEREDGPEDKIDDKKEDERAENWQKAHDAFSTALQIYSKEKHPRQYATTENNLANLYLAWRGKEDGWGDDQSPQHCLKAIQAAEEALCVFSFDESPDDYAEAQGTLWLAYLTIADYELRGDYTALALALDACQMRLKALRAGAASPTRIASCCKDLAITASMMADLEESVQSKAMDCKTAISAAKEALKFYNSMRYPVENAETQILLWAAYSALAEVEDGQINCSRAISACRAAISIFEEGRPKEHADAQKSLGYSLITLAEIEGGWQAAQNCEKAIEAYRLALEYYTPTEHPIDHADILRDLAYAYVTLSGAASTASNNEREERTVGKEERGEREECCKKALLAYKTAQKIYREQSRILEQAEQRRASSALQEKAEKCSLSMQSCKAIIRSGRKNREAGGSS